MKKIIFTDYCGLVAQRRKKCNKSKYCQNFGRVMGTMDSIIKKNGRELIMLQLIRKDVKQDLCKIGDWYDLYKNSKFFSNFLKIGVWQSLERKTALSKIRYKATNVTKPSWNFSLIFFYLIIYLSNPKNRRD
jgi:hypothetical protein